MTTGAVWEEVSGPMTGLAGPTRMEVGRIGSTVDTPGREGMSWLSATISPPQSLHALGGNTTTQNPAYSSDRAIRFYDDAGDGNDITAYRQVTLSTVWNRESLKDFSDNGLANRFNYGYGEAVEHLVNTGSAKDFSPHRNMGKDMDSVDLKSFVPNAKAFDAVLKFFADKEKVLAEWMKQLGDDDAAWRGTSADAFRELIDGIHTGYKNLVSELSAAPGAPATLMAYVSPAYTPTSAVGRMLIEAANEIHRAADELCTAWRTWRDHPGGGHLQTHHLDYWLDEVSVYLNENNITKTVDRSVSRIAGWGQGFGLETIVRRGKLPGFSVTHPVFGDLRNPEAWQKLGEAAYKSWVAGTGNAAGPIGLTELDKTAGQVAIRLYNSLNALANATPSAYAFTTGFTNLRARFDVREAERKAADAQREAERQKEEMEKKLGGGGQPPPGLGPGGAGSKDGGLGIGGPGAPEPPPGLDLNGPGPGTGVGGPGTGIGGPGTGIGGPGTGVGGPGGLKPPPGLDPNGPGGGDKNVIRNPDGSVSVRNPDGSYTTTRPDGSKVTTPPGVLPPGLG
ncbi:AAWKG family protein, partial [Streptomyces clavuligerus]